MKSVFGIYLTFILIAQIQSKHNPYHVTLSPLHLDGLNGNLETVNQMKTFQKSIVNGEYCTMKNKRDSACTIMIFLFKKNLELKLWEADACDGIGLISFLI